MPRSNGDWYIESVYSCTNPTLVSHTDAGIPGRWVEFRPEESTVRRPAEHRQRGNSRHLPYGSMLTTKLLIRGCSPGRFAYPTWGPRCRHRWVDPGVEALPCNRSNSGCLIAPKLFMCQYGEITRVRGERSGLQDREDIKLSLQGMQHTWTGLLQQLLSFRSAT